MTAIRAATATNLVRKKKKNKSVHFGKKHIRPKTKPREEKRVSNFHSLSIKDSVHRRKITTCRLKTAIISTAEKYCPVAFTVLDFHAWINSKFNRAEVITT